MKSTIDNAEKNTGIHANDTFVDQGYKGKSNQPDDVNVYVTGRKGLKRVMKKLIDPIIGHVKQAHRMDRNYLHGAKGDKINALLSGCAFNLRKIVPKQHSVISYVAG